MQPLGDGGIEDVAGLLEGAKRRRPSLGPHIAVIARGIVIAGEDVAELGRPVPQRDFREAFRSPARLLEGADLANGDAGWV